MKTITVVVCEKCRYWDATTKRDSTWGPHAACELARGGTHPGLVGLGIHTRADFGCEHGAEKES